MPAVAKKTTKTLNAKNEEKAPKKSSIKKLQKTAALNAAKKSTKLESKKAISQKLNIPFVKRQKSKHQFDPKRLKRGIVLLQNIPHGFYEKQMKKYFGQYGDVTRMRLARSEKTGRSKHFAFIEFRYPEVAQIAAESLNHYIMFRQRLRTVYIPPEKQDHDYFKQKVRVAYFNDGKVKRLLTPKLKQAHKAVKEINKPKTAERIAEIIERSKYKLKFLEKKLAKSGINLDLSGQLYSSGSTDEAEAPPLKKTTENGKASKEDAKKNKSKVEKPKPNVAKTTKKGKKIQTNDDNGNTTWQSLLENTIQTEDESDDDDYEPTPEELSEADEFVPKFLSAESSDDENDTTLNRLLNDTIDSEESDGDEDYVPTEAEIEEAKAVRKAMLAAKKLAKIDSNDLNARPNAKDKKPNQKKRKVFAEDPANVADVAPTKAKKKKVAKKAIAEPVKVSMVKAKKTLIEQVKAVKAPRIKPFEKLEKPVKKNPKAAAQLVKKTTTAPPKPTEIAKKSKDTKKVINPLAIKKKADESVEPKLSKSKKNALEPTPSHPSKMAVKKTPKPDTSPKAKATTLKKKVRTKKI